MLVFLCGPGGKSISKNKIVEQKHHTEHTQKTQFSNIKKYIFCWQNNKS